MEPDHTESRHRDRRSATLQSARIATIAAVVVLAMQVASKTARDAVFLGAFGAHALPKVMTAAAVLSLVAVALGAGLAARLGSGRFLTSALLLNAGLYVGELALARFAPDVAAVALYLHVAALGALLVSGLWSLVGGRFDPHRARSVVGRIATGATLGGAFGGVVADGVHRVLGAEGLLVVLMLASLAGAALVHRFASLVRRKPTPPLHRGTSGSSALRDAPYLGGVAALGLAIATSQAILDFAFKEQVAEAFRSEGGMITFFGWYHTAVGLLTFLAQWAVGSRLAERFGFALPLALLPGFLALGGLGCVAAPSFLSLVVLRGGETMIANGVYHTGYEVLFTPLRDAVRRPAKLLVDVAASRLGDGLGALLLFVMLAFLPDLPLRGLLVGVSVLGLLALAVVPSLQSGYVSSLVAALREGAIRLDADAELDATTRRTLGETRVAIDRERLLREIELFRQAADPPEPSAGELDLASRAARAPLVIGAGALDALGTADRASLEQKLAEPLDPRLARAALPLLLDEAARAPARRALERCAARATGALEDAMLDADEDLRLRQWAAVLLGGVAQERAREALVRGLSAESFPVRAAAGRALVRLSRAHAELALPRERVAAAIALGLERARNEAPESPDAQPLPTNLDPPVLDLPDATLAELDPLVVHVLGLASLVLDPRAVGVTARALAGHDETLRGTAIEYLDNVLPRATRELLLDRLREREADEPAPPSLRSASELEALLLRERH